MSTKKKTPQQRRQANIRAEAARARKQQARRRRQITWAGIVVVGLAVVLVLAVVVGGGDGETDVSSDASSTSSTVDGSTTTVAAAESAKGKDCVAVSDTPPPGAPPVPVRTGPPPTELVTEDIKQGDGATVNAGDNLTVQYIGVSCSTGKIFDSSYQRNEPASFPLSGVIEGWQKGIPGMKVGGQRLLGIPPEQAYGAQGSPPNIAPDETLWFVVEVLDAKPAAG